MCAVATAVVGDVGADVDGVLVVAVCVGVVVVVVVVDAGCC